MVQLDLKRLSALLARARREIGVNQHAVAHAVRVSLRTLSRWENGRHYPDEQQARDLAIVLSTASGETWRALVDALRLPLDEMLEECPDQRAALDGSREGATSAGQPAKAAKTAAIVSVEPEEPMHVVPLTATVELQGTVDDLIRAYAEEADMSPRRLRLVLGLLLGELHMMGVDVEEGRALVMHARRRLR
jgi:transcriptional regulator with XRE-family HTH domain